MRIVFSGFAVGIWPLFIIILIALLALLRYRKYSVFYLACFFIFGMYLLYILDKIFFPIQISGEYVDALRQQPFISDINLNPFYFGRSGTLQTALPGLLMNIVLTIPFGFGINFIRQIKAKRFVWLAPSVGLVFEGTQLLISLLLRYPYRQIDINDVLMNALGVLIGYALFRLFAWLYVWVTHRLDIAHVGLGAYIYDIANSIHKSNSNRIKKSFQ